nr:IST1 homolog [Tanacetum cinerariifolium]
MATVDINGPSICNSEQYGDAIHASNADTSSNWQSASGTCANSFPINCMTEADNQPRSTHGLPNINTRSRSRRATAVISVALSRATTPRTTKNIVYKSFLSEIATEQDVWRAAVWVTYICSRWMESKICPQLITSAPMSLLNQIFNRGLIGAKCKTSLTLAISRIKLLQNKRDTQLKQMRKEIAQFLLSGQEPIARIRVEHIIREQNIWAAEKECPLELKEAVASIIFAAPRCSDLPDLLTVRNLFGSKYGKEFIAAATELRPDTSVNRTIVEKLSVYTPPGEVKLKVLKEIAQEYNVLWNSSKTEAEFNKIPEDLLNGPKQISTVTQFPESRKEFSKAVNREPSISKQRGPVQPIQPPETTATMESSSPTTVKQSSAESPKGRPVSPESLDVLERARAAIAAADRASAAARAAAELVKVNL